MGASAEWVGVKVRVNKPTSLTALARFRAANSTAQHNVSLYALPSSRVVASALVDMSGDTLDRFGFMWETMSTAVELAAGEYVLASEEIPGGDPYYLIAKDGPCVANSDGHDGGSPWVLPLVDHVSVLGASRSVGGGVWNVSSQSDQSQHAYGPVNMALDLST